MDTVLPVIPEKPKRGIFTDLRKLLSDIAIRATKNAFQSVDFESGVRGWRLNANGLIEATRLQLDNFVSETNSGITYSGSWAQESAITLYGGTRKVSSTVGDTFTIEFRGPSIGLIMEKGANQGKLDVSIDGGSATEVDLYSTILRTREVVFSAENLGDRSHTLVATVKTKNASSTANTVGLQGYVRSPTEGIKLTDISANLVAYTGDMITDANGYVKSTAFTVPASTPIVWQIVGMRLTEAVMSDATATDPKFAWRATEHYLYNGAGTTTYEVTRAILCSAT